MSEPDKRNSSIWLRSEIVAPWLEIFVVLFFVLGYFIFSAARIGFYRQSGHAVNLLPSNYGESHLVAVESLILALFLGFLRWRGWTPLDFKIRIGWRSSLQGILLLLIWLLMKCGSLLLIWRLRAQHSYFGQYAVTIPHHALHHRALSLTIVIVGQIMNAYFEELTVMGYAFNQVAAKRGPLFALIVTTGLRLLYHTWQQPISLIDTGLGFLVFGAFYWRYQTLWPLIVAHVLFDILLICTATTSL